jgi:hypothetical protein
VVKRAPKRDGGWAVTEGMRATAYLLSTALLCNLAACGDDQDPNGARELWDRIHEQGYQAWDRAPGYEARRQSDAPHGDAVDIYVNETVASALASGVITAWPVGSLIVKDGFDDDDPHLVAAMEKRADGWFWAEWSPDGEASYSGRPEVCTSCHASGADMVRAFGLPK